jgi:hypothetical protein
MVCLHEWYNCAPPRKPFSVSGKTHTSCLALRTNKTQAKKEKQTSQPASLPLLTGQHHQQSPPPEHPSFQDSTLYAQE